MSIAASQAAHQEPAHPGPGQQGGEPPPADPPVGRRRHPWHRRILLGLGALLVATVTVLGVLAGTYQPLQFGGSTGIRFTGLPTATGSTFVNTFGGQPGDSYIPPQAGPFTVVLSLSNSGPEPVTIEAVSMLSPQQQAEQAQGVSPLPLVPAGRARWLPETYRAGQAGKPLDGLSLAPGQDIIVGLPVRMHGRCYDPGGFASLSTFYVKVRFGFFSRWVAVQFQPDLLIHQSYNPGEIPAKDLTCPPGTAR